MKLRDLLELMRVSNLPTVWSNVFLGVVTGFWIGISDPLRPGESVSFAGHLQVHWPLVFVVLVMSLLGISSIYCAGMVLNDYWDREIDARERPSRPIPSGRVTPVHARAVLFVLFVTGLFFSGGWQVLFFSAWRAEPKLLVMHFLSLIALISCVVLYNRIHHRKWLGVITMGLCRAFAFLTPAVIFAPWPYNLNWYVFLLGPAISLFVYTLFLSMVARREVDPERHGFGGPKTVMNMIAAMPLLDAVWLIAMGLWPASLVCVACAGLTKLGHRRIAGS